MMWIIFALLLKVKTLPIYCNLHKVFVRCYSQFVMYFSGENSFHVSGFSLKLATDFRTTWSENTELITPICGKTQVRESVTWFLKCDCS